MSPLNFTHILTQAVDELSESESYKGLFHQHKDGEPLPSAKVLYEIRSVTHVYMGTKVLKKIINFVEIQYN